MEFQIINVLSSYSSKLSDVLDSTLQQQKNMSNLRAFMNVTDQKSWDHFFEEQKGKLKNLFIYFLADFVLNAARYC